MAFPDRIGPVLLTTVNTTFFTAKLPLRLTWMVYNNASAAQASITFSIVPAGDVQQLSNTWMNAMPVLAKTFSSAEVRIPMRKGDTLQGSASANNSIVFIFEWCDEKKLL